MFTHAHAQRTQTHSQNNNDSNIFYLRIQSSFIDSLYLLCNRVEHFNWPRICGPKIVPGKCRQFSVHLKSCNGGFLLFKHTFHCICLGLFSTLPFLDFHKLVTVLKYIILRY